MSAISPADWEDMELGAAWRRAREAAGGHAITLEGPLFGNRSLGSLEQEVRRYQTDAGRGWHDFGRTPTAALDALTAALRERST